MQNLVFKRDPFSETLTFLGQYSLERCQLLEDLRSSKHVDLELGECQSVIYHDVYHVKLALMDWGCESSVIYDPKSIKLTSGEDDRIGPETRSYGGVYELHKHNDLGCSKSTITVTILKNYGA